ncbi:MAG TPA: HAMP domain-containing sensor histidine kinase [Rhizomicrobium sp.]|jgi:signal transduction histidine kinase|nr:HAMP domain-containing sensor histidine kinase [Rhizomicrobium sp.]
MSLWPRRLLPRTLAAQLVVVAATAVIVSNAAVGIWFATTQERMTESYMTGRLVQRAVDAATLLSGIAAHEREAAVNTMSSGPWRFKLIYGKPVVHPMTDEEARYAARARAMLPPQKQKQPVSVTIYKGLLPSSNGPDIPRSGMIVEVTLPVVRRTQLVTQFSRPAPEPWPLEVIVAGVVAVLTTSLAAAFVARRIARPISQLAAAASEAAAGGQAPSVPEEGPDDVRRAAHAFNRMTDRVTKTLESQRQLLSAVGHDLRTPITAMRINSEFIEDAELRQGIQKNLEELQELTEAVLSAGRGAGGEKMRKIDLAALIESLCTDLDEMGQPVSWCAHAAAPVKCRPNEIRRAVRNLIQNAVAYGSRADVCLCATPDCYNIVVEDEGPGIPEKDRVRVFEPFVRLDESRSAETGGSGLGLTLVKAIAEGHGGQIALQNRPERGLRACLTLPREPADA